MKEINYTPSIQDNPTEMTTSNSQLILVRNNLTTFTLIETFSQTLIFAFKSKSLGDYFDLRPNIVATDAQLIQLVAIKSQQTFGKELRLTLSNKEKVILNEKDDLRILKKLDANIVSARILYSPHRVWKTPNEGYLTKILMTERFVSFVEQMAHGSDPQYILIHFWLDYCEALGKPNISSGYRRAFPVQGEFTQFVAKPYKDGTVLFDLPDNDSAPQS